MLAKRFFPPVGWPSRKWCRRPVALSRGVVFLPLAFCVSLVIAQEKKAAQEDETPSAEDVVLQTSDGVRLAATYYPGANGKETIPVILLHMFKGNRNDYSQLAPFLRSQGHAVLVPDLRGHGDSTMRKGSTIPLNAASMSRTEFTGMVLFDLPRLKRFLIEKNNAGELNIEKLCVVGAEMGASVALNWARVDWNTPPEGHKKQGQDVKALVVISPDWSTPGLPLRTTMSGRNLTTLVYDRQLQKVLKYSEELNFAVPVELDFRTEVSMMIVAGEDDSKPIRDAKRLHSLLESHRAKVARRYPNAQTEKDLFYGTLKTSLQGTKMLGVRGLNLEGHIAQFIKIRLIEGRPKSFAWSERRDPYAR